MIGSSCRHFCSGFKTIQNDNSFDRGHEPSVRRQSPLHNIVSDFTEALWYVVGLATHGYAKPRGNAGGCLAGRRRCNGDDLYRTTYTV